MLALNAQVRHPARQVNLLNRFEELPINALSQTTTKRQTPEDLELEAKRSELAALSERLADAELQLKELQVSLTTFQRRYFQEVGLKYIELDDLRAQIAEELARKKPKDTQAKDTAQKAREQAEASSKEFDAFANSDQSETEAAPPSEDCKKLYRRIACLIHPDKATDDVKRELGGRLMQELNDAYAKRDMKRMERILAEWEESPDTVSGEGTAMELVRVIRAIAQVRRRIDEVGQVIEETMGGELHSLMTAAHKADAEGRDILSELKVKIEGQIGAAKKELESLRRIG